MNALFIANLQLSETEGIFKKVCAESDAVGHAVGSCQLVTRRGNRAVVKAQDEAEQKEQELSFFDYIINMIADGGIELLYVRHMIPSPALINILKKAKEKKVKVYYEIPTYPYFGEQFKTSRRKHRAIIKILLDVIFWPLIYRYITKLVVIRSNTKTKMFSKMIEISNGVKTNNIVSKNYNNRKQDNVFRMVAVGTLYPYHGYDRVLEGLAKCGETINGKTIEFHVVGASQTIDELHQMSDKLKLNHVDTTLKIIEYYCRGVMVITSGMSPMDKVEKKYTIHVEDSEEPIDIGYIISAFENTTIACKTEIAEKSKSIFSWDSIMQALFSEKMGD